VWAGLPIDSNPWAGSDRVLTAAIRERVDLPLRLPDGPPLNPAELARYRLKLAEGIEQSYAAVYRESDYGSNVVVYGLEFSSDQDAADFRGRARIAATEILAIGRIVAAVSGPPGSCIQAIIAHIRSLG
jgi:hypothetical protein